MLRQNRRTFLKRAAATGVAATFTIAGTASYAAFHRLCAEPET